ncbi:amidohydrolase family protein [Plastorhodobacter daqingensis]|uniref:Amidohydrolase family protein n=1 Tax=Plastorhodobacter daqingensis TaxID=1387281 RepID=A0ABW2UL78_9RHOB
MSDPVLEAAPVAETRARQKVVDCDIHPAYASPEEMLSYLPDRWRRHVRDFGVHSSSPLMGALPYPRLAHGMRQDSYPPSGGPPASDLAFLQQQLLDPLNIEFGILQPLSAGHGALNAELGAALCAGTNDWQIDKWMSKDSRLRGSLAVMQEDAAAALREIEARAADKRFVQVSITPRTLEPAGRRRYWPIYEAAAHHGLPISMHSAAYGPRANTGSGWTSFYIEEHFAFSHAAQTSLISMIFEGVFDAFPGLKLILVEGGFAWLPPLVWRMEREWDRMRAEVPHLRRSPAEYVRDHVWLTTQPVEEPPQSSQLADVLRWVGMDRLLFSTDYPHWDFDHPDYAFRTPLTPAEKAMLLRDNAVAVFGLT